MSVRQEIAVLTRGVARAVGATHDVILAPRVTSIRPHVRLPLEHAYTQLVAANTALEAAGYALAHALTMEGEGGES